MSANDRQVHPAAELFPTMNEEEFAALRSSIKEQGQLAPIELLGSMIIDGRSRARACRDLDISPRTVELDPATIPDPLAFVIGKNVARRHLGSGQLAICAVRAADLYAKLKAGAAAAALSGVSSGGSAGGRGHANPPQRIGGSLRPSKHGGEVDEKLAVLFQTNRSYVRGARQLDNEAPELAESVLVGAISLPKAMKQLDARKTCDPDGDGGKRVKRPKPKRPSPEELEDRYHKLERQLQEEFRNRPRVFHPEANEGDASGGPPASPEWDQAACARSIERVVDRWIEICPKDKRESIRQVLIRLTDRLNLADDRPAASLGTEHNSEEAQLHANGVHKD